jgi:5'-3' exonuclease
VRVHLIDGTYELFRHYYAVPSARDGDGREIGAVRGVVASILGMINRGATHVGVATDQVIESFRNRMWPGYKKAVSALGIVLWPMVEFEADDALAAAAARASLDTRVEKVFICTPDKDLAQCVRGTRVVQLIRRTGVELDEDAVVKKFGVAPASIPDYLALVGDSADGYPGLPGWGAKSTAAVLAKFKHIDLVPADWKEWRVNATSAASLAATLERERDRALLFRDLATLRTEIPVFDSVDELQWTGPTERFPPLAARFDAAITAPRKGEMKR